MPFTAKNIARCREYIAEHREGDTEILATCCQCKKELTLVEFFMRRDKAYCLDCFAVLPYDIKLRYRELRKGGRWTPRAARELIRKELAGESEWIVAGRKEKWKSKLEKFIPIIAGLIGKSWK